MGKNNQKYAQKKFTILMIWKRNVAFISSSSQPKKRWMFSLHGFVFSFAHRFFLVVHQWDQDLAIESTKLGSDWRLESQGIYSSVDGNSYTINTHQTKWMCSRFLATQSRVKWGWNWVSLCEVLPCVNTIGIISDTTFFNDMAGWIPASWRWRDDHNENPIMTIS